MALPEIVSREQWLKARLALLAEDWDAACPVCTEYTSEFTDALMTRLRDRDTAFAMVCRAPLAKIEAYTAGRGWALPWYSSYGSRPRSWTTTTGQSRACSATRRPPRCRVRAASCATVAGSSTRTRPTPGAWTTSISPTPSPWSPVDAEAC